MARCAGERREGEVATVRREREVATVRRGGDVAGEERRGAGDAADVRRGVNNTGDAADVCGVRIDTDAADVCGNTRGAADVWCVGVTQAMLRKWGGEHRRCCGCVGGGDTRGKLRADLRGGGLRWAMLRMCVCVWGVTQAMLRM